LRGAQFETLVVVLSEILENEAAVKGMLEMFRSEVAKVCRGHQRWCWVWCGSVVSSARYGVRIGRQQ
jgi:hypothetical protein